MNTSHRMPTQQHRILRQVLEARVRDTSTAAPVQARLRSLYFDELLPILDRLCSELSASERIHRIERLQIDIDMDEGADGRVSDRFAAAVRHALTGAIATAAAADAQLESFAFFLETGTLPWWAERLEHQSFAASLQALVQRSPRAVRTVIEGAVARESALRRLARSYSDAALDELVCSLLDLAAPGTSLGGTWRGVLAACKPPAATDFRNVWWEEALHAALAAKPGSGDVTVCVVRCLRRVMARSGRDVGSELRRAMSSPTTSLPRAVRAGIEAALQGFRESGREAAGAVAQEGTVPGTEVAVHAAFIARHGIDSERTPDAKAVSSTLAPASSDQQASIASGNGNTIASVKNAGPAQRPTTEAHSLRANRLQATEMLLTASPQQHQLQSTNVDRADVRRASSSRTSPESSVRVQQLFHTGAGVTGEVRDTGLVRSQAMAEMHGVGNGGQPSPARAFSDADALYIDNAGLVMLWPFLTVCFDRLGLVEGKRFKSAAAMHRAVALLQYMACNETAFPEYVLPLNKVLCGLPLEQVADPGPELSEQEADECGALLDSVIEHARVLGKISIAGLRNAFLLRKGQLSVRDGHWLLRVEYLTHDILLERLPWSLQIIKLPWMQALLQVEWREFTRCTPSRQRP